MCSSPTITSTNPLPTTRSAATPVYGSTVDEADGSEAGVAEGAVGMTQVPGGGGGVLYPPVEYGAAGDPVP